MTGDAIFEIAYAFGMVMCGLGIYLGFAYEEEEPWLLGLAPGFAGFLIFPVMNTLIGGILLFYMVYKWAESKK